MKFNINDSVRVRLTDVGRGAILRNHNSLFGAKAGSFTPRKVEEDEDGWSTWQLWCLMQEFGPHMRNGSPIPFETEIEIIETDR